MKVVLLFASVTSILLVWNIVQLMTNKSLKRELSDCDARLQSSTRQQRLMQAAVGVDGAGGDDVEARAMAFVKREREAERAKCAETARQLVSLRAESESLVRSNFRLERQVASAAGGGGSRAGNDTCGADVRRYVAELVEENRVLRSAVQKLLADDGAT